MLVGGLVFAGLWLRPRFGIGRIRTDGVMSYYVYSGAKAGPDQKLPTIIFIGHPHDSPFRALSVFRGWFDKPVLLIWSGLLSDVGEDRVVDDEVVWATKRQRFLTLLNDYERRLPIDESRIYLTGFSFAGVYAWMLAYDHPELYAAVVPMSATSYPRQIQGNLEAAKALVTVVVRGEKDHAFPRGLAGETRTGKMIESYNPCSRFVLKAGEGHRDMGKYWREYLQYVLQFHRKDNQKMTKNAEDRAVYHREAFLNWAKRAALPVPTSAEEPLNERTQAALDRMLAGKRFVFRGEPDHCIVEKYPFRLTLIRYLFTHGWRHVGMETGRSLGWWVDRYLETGDASCLDASIEPPSPTDVAIHGRTLGFIEEQENPFHEQLRQISESRAPGMPRLHYGGFDLDLGVPLAAIQPIRQLLGGYADSQIHELLVVLDRLGGLSTNEQLAHIETIRQNLPACANALTKGTFDELQSWVSFLHDSIAAENRPRMNQDLRAHHRWRAEREQIMMQYLDQIVEALGGDEKLILLGHNGHLSKDTSRLRFHPQQSRFWGWRSWLRALGYGIFFKLTGYPAYMSDSVGAHLNRRFPGQVLSIWMLYGQGTLMMPKGPGTVRLRGDTVESLLAQVGDRFLLPLNDVDPQAMTILSCANIRSAQGEYASADLTCQADALYFVKDVNAL